MINRFNTFQWHLPGMRMLKTCLAVTLCMFFYMLIGFQGEAMPAEAAITAIICIQPDVRNTTENGLNRLSGTIIGAIWGFWFLLGMMWFPEIGDNRVVLYLLEGLGTLVAIYTAVMVRQPDAAGLAAIVFVCVVISYPDIVSPLQQAFTRIFDVLLGTSVALFVNGFHLPRIKKPNKVFFIPLSSLTDNQFAQMPVSVLYRLQALLHKGAKICLMSAHAPAFHATQLSTMDFTVPMIVMDGAAIYDPKENEYITTTNLNPASCRWLMKRLDGQSYFISTVHKNRNCIFHHGEMTELENTVYSFLKRSPYRYYLDDDHFSPSDVVYIKIVTTQAEADRLQRELEPMLQKMDLRSVIRPQAGLKEGCSLYFYAAHADMEHARTHLMRLLKAEKPELEMCAAADDGDYSNEASALRLLSKVDSEFEPLALTEWLRHFSHRLRQPASL